MIQWKGALKNSVKLLGAILLLSFFLSIFVEFLARGSFKDVWVWGVQNYAALIASYLAVLGFFLLFTGLIGRTRIAFGVTSFLFLFPAVVSGIKWKTEGIPLFPWDLVLGLKNFHISPQFTQYFTLQVIFGIVLFAGLFHILLYRLNWFRNRLKAWSRVATAISALILISIPYADKLYPIKKQFNLAPIPWNQEQGYNKNGFLLSSMMNADLAQIEEPRGYGAARMHAILNGMNQPKTPDGSTIRPNIIVVLSEAFWDPTIMNNVQFSTDPIPTFHHLAQQFPSGWMLSPQFGGGTANVEFEVLTGNSMRFLPDGSIPYVNYLIHGVDSMASVLSRDGYSSTAINPLDSWFFHSKTAYQNMGFSRFISSEFFPDNKEGLFLSDHEVANQIIEASNQSSGPDFIFANTMENHYPFYPGKFKENTIKVSGNLTDASKGELETYAQGISNADKMLKQLVDYYSDKGEPTMVVFFGDHMPALADSVYKETHYFSDDDPDLWEKKYRVPVLVWNNYLPEQKDSLYISPSFLGPYALHQAGVQGSSYTDYLYNLSQRIPVIPPESDYAKMNIPVSELEDYKLLEYDALFGNQYAYEKLSQPIVNPQYALGPADIVVAQATPSDQSGGEESLAVSGKNFPPDSVLFVNDKPLPTKVENMDHLSVSIPKEEFKLGEPVNLQVKVLDSRHFVVAKSNSMQVNVKQ